MFRIMGNHCSSPRTRSRKGNKRDKQKTSTDETTTTSSADHTSLRHAIVSAVPDGSITALYPVDDNYIELKGGLRSPKSLAELATDSLCRALPCLDGELPAGLPQDVIDDVVRSLIRHSALNATTLRILRQCPLGELSLAGCRGVTDQWLAPLMTQGAAGASCTSCSSSSSAGGDSHSSSSSSSNSLQQQQQEQLIMPPPALYRSDDCMEVDHHQQLLHGGDEEDQAFFSSMETKNSSDNCSSCSTETFCSAASAVVAEKPCPVLEPSPSPTSFPSSLTSNLTILDLRGSQRLTDQGLMQLTFLHRLEVARFDNCHSIQGRGLVALTHSHQLCTLSMNNCRRLTDEALIQISHLMSLENLSLGGCRCLTDCALAAISDLYNLRKLDLSQCDLLTDSGLAMLEQLEMLEELSLGWCRTLTDTGLKVLVEQPGRTEHLRVLSLARCNLTDAGLPSLAELKAIEELDLNGCHHFTSQATGKALQQLPNLTSLDVSYCPNILRAGWQGKIDKVVTLELCYAGVTDAHLKQLQYLPALHELNLDSCPVGDAALGHLANQNVTPNLVSLDLADTDLTDMGMQHIAKFRKLQRLSIFYCDVSNRGLRHISLLQDLETLNLDSRDISDEGLRHLRKLSKLKNLDIFSGRITDNGCGHLSKIRSLETLELCGGSIGDQGCSFLGSLENLTSLNLSQNERISNRGAAALAALTNLKALNLSNTRVNSSALCYFSGLYELQSLSLYGCQGMENGSDLAKLRDGLPKLKCLRLDSASDMDGRILPSMAAASDSFLDLPMEEDDTESMDIYSDHD